MLTRQRVRQALRRLKKNSFPFPEFARKIRAHLAIHPTHYVQCRSANEIVTNLSGEDQTLDLIGFYTLLKGLDEKEST